ncbi:MAG TPA: pullulanase-type alpha-1,6-glucosidase, partial [Anaerolineae bacterium]|nr:pullulanase-type alpha-1,6-glucosidase [Anaerolineae bacterium]
MKWRTILTLWLALLLTLPASPARAQSSVTLVGTFQKALGCRRDGQVDCEQTTLFYDWTDGVWQATFEIPAGDYTYHAVLNQDAKQVIGAGAGGADIRLTLAAPTAVKFYYDPQSGWLTDNHHTTIATLVGDFQTALGCAANDDPACLRGWLQDPDGDGVATFSTTVIPPGEYVVRVALNESSTLWYGAHSMQNGLDIPFAISETDPRADFRYDAATHELTVDTAAPLPGDLTRAQAHWLARDTFLWPGVDAEGLTFFLHASPEGGLRLRSDGIAGGRAIALQPGPADPALLARFPHLRGVTLKLPADALPDVPALLKGALALSAWRADENGQPVIVAATSLQIPGVLDDLFTYRGPLGVTYEGGVPTLRVWAPTAQSVRLHRFINTPPYDVEAHEMQADPITGVWSITGAPDWTYCLYLYEVTVYAPSVGRIVMNLVTDPYSFSLAQNSTRSQIVELADPALKPPGWEALTPAFTGSPVDMAIYELHVRDFSVNDPTVPEAYRGTFKAFTLPDSAGMRHLRALAESGLTHLHLLPVFDIASVNEDKSTWVGPDFAALSVYPPDSEEQQAALAPFRDRDGFNWGYDPLHYTVPEGSYSTNPDGPTRILEFREMVQSLNHNGMGVIMDVVYNHTFASGQNPNSVLDKIVPGYYHRLDADGQVEHSTCCENTATEHAMMEKLMVDSIVTWATAYKVRGFRFDIMGHHMLANMQAVRTALDALTPEKDGVDGKRIYVYGEGWNFGEVADNQRGVNATQINVAGTGIGAFNDRMRDAARGGSAFG